jgi:hypothetical protein
MQHRRKRRATDGLQPLQTAANIELDFPFFERLESVNLDRRKTKTSAPPSSCVMKPKPFSALNHFTLPILATPGVK